MSANNPPNSLVFCLIFVWLKIVISEVLSKDVSRLSDTITFMLWFLNLSTHARTTLPSFNIAGWEGWSEIFKSFGWDQVLPSSLLILWWILRKSFLSESYVQAKEVIIPFSFTPHLKSQLKILELWSSDEIILIE